MGETASLGVSMATTRHAAGLEITEILLRDYYWRLLRVYLDALVGDFSRYGLESSTSSMELWKGEREGGRAQYTIVQSINSLALQLDD